MSVEGAPCDQAEAGEFGNGGADDKYLSDAIVGAGADDEAVVVNAGDTSERPGGGIGG